MVIVTIYARNGEDLETQITALGATTIHLVVPLHSKPEYLVVYTP